MSDMAHFVLRVSDLSIQRADIAKEFSTGVRKVARMKLVMHPRPPDYKITPNAFYVYRQEERNSARTNSANP